MLFFLNNSILLFFLGFQFIYIQSQGDYSFKIRENNDLEIKTLEKGYIETFTVKDNMGIENFVLSVTKINIEPKVHINVYDEKFKQTFLDKCNCQITEDKIVDYKSFKARQYKVKMFLKNKVVISYILSLSNEKGLYSISYTSNNIINLEKYWTEFEAIMNSMKIVK